MPEPKVKTYTGEIVRAETGDEGTYATQSIREVVAKIRSLKEGDAITINVDMQDRWYTTQSRWPVD